MPVIIPPTYFDVPAVTHVAAHSVGRSSIAGHSAVPPLGLGRPSVTVQGPTESPPVPPAPTKPAHSNATGVPDTLSGQDSAHQSR
jgi:hypothetical protein